MNKVIKRFFKTVFTILVFAVFSTILLFSSNKIDSLLNFSKFVEFLTKDGAFLIVVPLGSWVLFTLVGLYVFYDDNRDWTDWVWFISCLHWIILFVSCLVIGFTSGGYILGIAFFIFIVTLMLGFLYILSCLTQIKKVDTA